MTSSVAAAQSSALQSQIGYAILGKQLTASKQQGEAVVKLLESAAKLSKSHSSGKQLDLVG
jgi:hypothetical protein